jgi:hypothetical protein
MVADRFGMDEMLELLGSMGVDAPGDTTKACLRCCKPHLEHAPDGCDYFGLCMECSDELISTSAPNTAQLEILIRSDMATRKWAVTT